MKPQWDWKPKLIWLSLFAISMAVLESLIVIYLRRLYYPENIAEIFPLRAFSNKDFFIELGRETATIIMLLAAAVLAERNNIIRVFAGFVFVFGLWDIFYYVWLKAFINWPVTWLDWDILFLIPWVWVGPWLCPALIALVFVIWGAMVISTEKMIRFNVVTLILFISGCIMELITFLIPTLPLILKRGLYGYTAYTPEDFWWWLFIPGFIIMCTGLAGTIWGKGLGKGLFCAGTKLNG